MTHKPTGYETYEVISEYPVLRNISDIFSLQWERAGIQPLLKVSGVYLLVDHSKLFPYDYVGQSKSIQSRLYWRNAEQHEVYDPNKHDIYFLRIKDDALMDYIENKIIHILNPTFNKNRGISKTIPDEIAKRDVILSANLLHLPYKSKLDLSSLPLFAETEL